MVAQTIAYGLFSARCTGQEVLGLAHLEAMVPTTNRFLKQLFAELANISGHKRGQINFDDLGLSEMVDLLNNTNIEAVLENFGRQTGGGKEDPVIHFYETFLNVYDKKQKVERGVFYTPKPVVSFIVRSIHEILQKEFGLPDGLADTTTWSQMVDRHPDLRIPPGVKPEAPFVQILDPATGTGTFLEEIIEVIHQTMDSKWRGQGKSNEQVRDLWNEYVPKNLLPRLHGFELMMAPYSVAHMKLGLKLKQTNYDFRSSQHLRVYLTNTLEAPDKGPRKLGFLPDFLSHESMQADLVKERKPITVIVGNPPYSGHSANKGAWISDLLRQRLPDGSEGYFTVDGHPLGERNPKWLNDDYVKFIRFCQYRLAWSGVGVLGFITNHSYLDNSTFRGMRQSLTTTFPVGLFLNAHGNTKKKETNPSGSADENVFDIQQGVAISLLRRPIKSRISSYSQRDLWGSRERKYSWLLKQTALTSATQPIEPVSPKYLLIPCQDEVDKEYTTALSLPEIFPVHSLGIATARDHFCVQWSQDDVWKTVRRFSKLRPEAAREEFDLGTDARDWKVKFAQDDVLESGPNRRWIQPILYRPFDERFTYYTGRSRGFHCMPRNDVMRHFLSLDNLGLIGARGIEVEREYDQVFCTRTLIQLHTLSLKEVNYVFPLHLAEDRAETLIAQERPANFSARFLQNLDRLGLARQTDWKQESFHYIYAILHSRSYRQRYREALRSDFPRIPVTGSSELFAALAHFGADLIALHLLDENYPYASWRQGTKPVAWPLSRAIPDLCGRGLPRVEPGYPRAEGERVYINASRWFERVSAEVFEVRIGGYQVCEKWLKDRRGLELSAQDIDRYRSTVGAIGSTLDVVEQIDGTISRFGGWPLPQSSQ